MIKIMMVDHEPKQLSPGELSVLYKAFKGVEIEFETTRPKGHKEHVENCRRIQPTVVLLPSEFSEWIPIQAMREGFRHIVVSSRGVSEVCPIRLGHTPDLKPFEI